LTARNPTGNAENIEFQCSRGDSGSLSRGLKLEKPRFAGLPAALSASWGKEMKVSSPPI
jgi:hypothetical protein